MEEKILELEQKLNALMDYVGQISEPIRFRFIPASTWVIESNYGNRPIPEQPQQKV